VFPKQHTKRCLQSIKRKGAAVGPLQLDVEAGVGALLPEGAHPLLAVDRPEGVLPLDGDPFQGEGLLAGEEGVTEG
jgi:hypothetical protein